MLQTQTVKLDATSKLLKYLAVTSGAFTAADKKLTKASAGFSTYFAAGDSVQIAGTSNNNGTFTVTAAGVNDITFSETVTDETSNCTLHGIYVGEWKDIQFFVRLIGTVYASQAVDFYIDQSNDPPGSNGPSNTDYTSTKIDVAASAGAAYSYEIVGRWARMRILLDSTTALTVHRSYLNGRTSS